MLKRSVAFLLILTSIIFITACTKQNENFKEFQYQVTVADSSDSELGINIEKDPSLWSRQIYTDFTLQDKVFEVKNTPVPMKGIYESSAVGLYARCADVISHQFRCDNLEVFSVDSEGKLVDFTRSLTDLKKSDGEPLSKQECLESAKKFFATMVEDINCYKVTMQYSESLQIYEVFFTKYVDGWATSDEARVSIVVSTGEVVQYVGPMVGKFDQNLEINIDREKVKEAVASKVDALIENLQKRYHRVEQKVESYMLTTYKNQYIIVCDIIIDCVRIVDGLEDISTEMICYVIH